jgi:hypothetical protein
MQELRIVTIRFGTRRDRKWSWNERQSPNVRGVRVALGTGYNRVEGNRRASRNSLMSDLPPKTRNFLHRCMPGFSHADVRGAGAAGRGPKDTHSHTHSHTHTLTHTHTHTHTLSHTLRHTLTHTLTHSRTHSHTHSLTLSHTHSHSLTCCSTVTWPAAAPAAAAATPAASPAVALRRVLLSTERNAGCTTV